jgi:hypothetical protein
MRSVRTTSGGCIPPLRRQSPEYFTNLDGDEVAETYAEGPGPVRSDDLKKKERRIAPLWMLGDRC